MGFAKTLLLVPAGKRKKEKLLLVPTRLCFGWDPYSILHTTGIRFVGNRLYIIGGPSDKQLQIQTNKETWDSPLSMAITSLIQMTQVQKQQTGTADLATLPTQSMEQDLQLITSQEEDYNEQFMQQQKLYNHGIEQ